MEISYYGGNCVRLNAKKVSVVIDDNLLSLGSKTKLKANVNIFTQKRFNNNKAQRFVIDSPGEYEVSEVSVLGIGIRARSDEKDKKTAIFYRIGMKGIMVAVTGHIYPNLTDEQLERLGNIDVLVIPVGGNGYTLDAKDAATVAKAIEPKIIIPTHYEESGIKFEVPQASVDDFFKELGVEPQEVDTLKLKSSTLPVDTQEVYKLNKS
jgi:L-ascorbate metabolism protein UlaG (beta-lactamase superfamily)